MRKRTARSSSLVRCMDSSCSSSAVLSVRLERSGMGSSELSPFFVLARPEQGRMSPRPKSWAGGPASSIGFSILSSRRHESSSSIPICRKLIDWYIRWPTTSFVSRLSESSTSAHLSLAETPAKSANVTLIISCRGRKHLNFCVKTHFSTFYPKNLALFLLHAATNSDGKTVEFIAVKE